MDILLLLVGLGLILGGANFLTDGSAAVAQRFRVPEFIIGLTIVAVGTSMPELVVSVLSAAAGNSDVAIGNVVGSNIFNVFVILGICALIRPLVLTKENIRRDIPFGIARAAGGHFRPPGMRRGNGQDRPSGRHRHACALHRADVVHDPHNQTPARHARCSGRDENPGI